MNVGTHTVCVHMYVYSSAMHTHSIMQCAMHTHTPSCSVPCTHTLHHAVCHAHTHSIMQCDMHTHTHSIMQCDMHTHTPSCSVTCTHTHTPSCSVTCTHTPSCSVTCTHTPSCSVTCTHTPSCSVLIGTGCPELLFVHNSCHCTANCEPTAPQALNSQQTCARGNRGASRPKQHHTTSHTTSLLTQSGHTCVGACLYWYCIGWQGSQPPSPKLLLFTILHCQTATSKGGPTGD